MFLSLLLSFSHLALAGSPCEAVQGLENSSVVCGSRETELFLKDQEKVTALTLVLEDKGSGRRREVQVNGLHLKVSQIKAKSFLVSPSVKKILAGVQKDWGVAPTVSVQALELEKGAHFYSAHDFKKEIKPSLLPNERRSVASSTQSSLQAAGVMRAQKKK